MATKTDNESVERVWDLMEKISICMLTTWDGNNLHSRPMDAHSRPADNAVYFLTDVRHHKDEEIERYPKLVLAFADNSGHNYASVSGAAAVLNDRASSRNCGSQATRPSGKVRTIRTFACSGSRPRMPNTGMDPALSSAWST